MSFDPILELSKRINDLAEKVNRLLGSQAPTNGWVVEPSGWTYASATTVTVSGDARNRYPVGTKVRWNDGSLKYGYVVAAVYTSSTLLTITGGSDYAVANAAISGVYYSYAVCPQGFPQWFNWTPTFTGFAVNPTINFCLFSITGRLLTFQIDCSADGTSNSVNLYTTAPVNAAQNGRGVWMYAVDNGAALTVGGRLFIASGVNIIQAIKDMGLSGWTNVGGKRANFIIQYII